MELPHGGADGATCRGPLFDFDRVDFVTSDHHFGHVRILELAHRPFASIEEMDTALAVTWNRRVGPGDVVLHLGDLALGTRAESIPFTAALNGKKLLVPGNHDVVSSVYQASAVNKARNTRLLEEAGWRLLPEILTGRRSGTALIASHFPYAGDSHGEDRFVHVRPRDRGSALMHGHTHAVGHGPHGAMFHVGVDAHGFAPVPMARIDEWLAL